MRRHPRSENRKIVRRLGEASVPADIGSRVFPFRSPPASMPSVRARRSTRVFVPKARDGTAATKPLRSAKPLALVQNRPDGDEGDWLPLVWWKQDEGKKKGLGGGGVIGWSEPTVVREPVAGVQMFDLVYSRKSGGQEPKDSPKESHKGRMFNIVYSRKRWRMQPDEAESSSSSEDRKYGIVYARRLRKKTKLAPVVEHVAELAPVETMVEEPLETMVEEPLGTMVEESLETVVEDREYEDAATQLNIPESSRNFAEQLVGISGDDFVTTPDDDLVLAVLLDPSRRGRDPFSTILISVVRWLRKPRGGLWGFAAILFCESLAGVLSLHGIHFLPLQLLKIDILSRGVVSGWGLCKIYRGDHFVPMLSIDFSTLPLYFKDLHVALSLGSLYLPVILMRNLMNGSRSEEEERYSIVLVESVLPNTIVTPSFVPVEECNELPSIGEAPEQVKHNLVIMHSSSLQKHQKRKRKTRTRVDRSIVISLPASSSSLQSVVEPIRVKPLEACLGDLIREEDDTSSPCGPLRSKKFDGGTKELRLALAEVKQNIDSTCCNANLLVIASDRCWREDGAELILEVSDSKEWCIAVKIQGTTRYLHKPQEWRPCAVNRLNHTYMWGWEDGWKLEFFDKWDWSVFKELHTECRERNMPEVPVKIIPVPGVQEVSDYDQIVTSFFMRPDMYIRSMRSELERAIASEISSYDMDSGDEEWLRQLSSSSPDLETSGLGHISEDDFEKMIFALEKEAYGNPNDIPDKEKAVDLFQDLGRRDVVAVVYDYWLKKRNKRRVPLVKVFQGPPLRRTQLIQKPYLRKKRSFTRQRSQGGRGKPDFYLQAGAQQEAKRRVQEAENAASRAVEAAVRQRSRAQMFMANAELAVYKSTMALSIAEAKRVSGTFHLASVIFND